MIAPHSSTSYYTPIHTGIGIDPIKDALPGVQFFGVCTWHIMALDFPRNLNHIVGYEDCKNFVYKHLVKNTTCKKAWEDYLSEACRKWPAAKEYLQNLSLSKERWGAPWRLNHFTMGMEASSVVEGSFSGFKKYLGGEPKSFPGVVQQHIQKDLDKVAEERKNKVKADVSMYDKKLSSQRAFSANQCAQVCSNKVVEQFITANLEAQEYSYEENPTLTDDQIARGVESAYTLHLKGMNIADQPARLVEKINGIYYCKRCMKDINSGQPCKHIQRVCDFEFRPEQFHDHWKRGNNEVVWLPAVPRQPAAQGMLDTDDDFDFGVGEQSDEEVYMKQDGSSGLEAVDDGNIQAGGDGVGEFVKEYVPQPLEAKRFRGENTKKKEKNSAQMYNDLLGKGTQLARIGAANRKTYEKLSTILSYMVANVQNQGQEELKEAAASYLNLTATGNGGLFNIQPSTLKRGIGGCSSKRKRSGVEAAASKQSGNKCAFCGQVGHNRSSCSAANQFGTRLTKKTWSLLKTVMPLDESKEVTDIDTIVHADAMALEIDSSKTHLILILLLFMFIVSNPHP